jgi:hypothetical protein
VTISDQLFDYFQAIQRVEKFVTCSFNTSQRRADGIRSLECIRIGRHFLLSKRPKIKVPRHCRDHIRSKYIVWKSSLVTEQRAIVRFLTLKKLSAKHITAELEGLYGHEALSLSVAKKWRK